MPRPKHTAAQTVQDPPIRLPVAGGDRRRRTPPGGNRRRVGAVAAAERRPEPADVAWFDEEAPEADEFPIVCRLIDPGFDDPDGCSGMEIGRWLGCPGASRADERDDDTW